MWRLTVGNTNVTFLFFSCLLSHLYRPLSSVNPLQKRREIEKAGGDRNNPDLQDEYYTG